MMLWYVDENTIRAMKALNNNIAGYTRDETGVKIYIPQGSIMFCYEYPYSYVNNEGETVMRSVEDRLVWENLNLANCMYIQRIENTPTEVILKVSV